MKLKRLMIVLTVILCVVLGAVLLTACGGGAQGEKGEKGDKGDTGESGQTPYIGTNGNWWIGETDTGVAAMQADNGVYFSGACGVLATWTLYKDGRLVISGSGDMGEGNIPSGFDELVTEIVVSDGITSIGDNAFSDYGSLKKITIGKDVSTIGEKAFYNDVSIVTVAIPSSVISIGKNAFGNCKSLANITIPVNVRSIGERAFYGCDKLKRVNLRANVTKIEKETFYGCSSLSGSLSLPDTVSTIGERAFYGCYSLTGVTIPTSVTFIEKDAFGKCYKLAEVYNNTELTFTPGASGNGCVAKYALTVHTEDTDPSKLSTDANDYVLYTDGSNVVLVDVPGEETALSLPENVTEIADYAFYGRGFSIFVLPASVRKINDYAFDGCDIDPDFLFCYKGTSKAAWDEIDQDIIDPSYVDEIVRYYAETHPATDMLCWHYESGKPVSGAGGEHNYGTDTRTCVQRTCKCGYVCEPTTPHHFLDNYCRDCDKWELASEGLEYRQLADGVETYYVLIGRGDNSDENLYIPAKYQGIDVIEIDSGAFYNDRDIKSVAFEKNSKLKSIEGYAFRGCYNLKTVSLPDSLATSTASVVIADNAFQNCPIVTATVPAVAIGAVSCDDLETLTITVGEIAEDAFVNCPNLIDVTVCAGVTNIAEAAFVSVDSIVSITVDAANARYSSENGILFNKDKTTLLRYPACKSGTSYSVPATVTSIVSKAFADCTQLTGVTIPENVTTIEESTFEGCTSLAVVVLHNGIVSIGSDAFLDCPITTATVPFSVMDNLPERYLTTLTITGGEISNSAFNHRRVLTSVTLLEGVTSIGRFAFEGCDNLASITLPVGLTSIGLHAFVDCVSLTSIAIPASATSLGDGLFDGCMSLTAITVDAENPNYASIGGVLFTKDGTTLICCPAAKTGEYTVPADVTDIGERAFEHGSLTSISIGENVTSIGEWAISFCTLLTSITVDANNPAFSSEDGVLFNKEKTMLVCFPGGLDAKDYEFPATVTAIGEKSFAGGSLTKISFRDGITSIGERAFLDCNSLMSIVIPASVDSIGGDAFDGCVKLYEVYNLSALTITAGSYDNGLVACYAKVVHTSMEESRISTDENGFVLYTDGEDVTLLAYTGVATELTLPGTVKVIAVYAFRNNKTLTSIIIPEGVVRIESRAFEGCTALSSVRIPASMEEIPDRAFRGCTSFRGVTYAGTMEQWFSNCSPEVEAGENDTSIRAICTDGECDYYHVNE